MLNIKLEAYKCPNCNAIFVPCLNNDTDWFEFKDWYGTNTVNCEHFCVNRERFLAEKVTILIACKIAEE